MSNYAVSLLTIEMTANSCVVYLIEDTILQFLIMRNNYTRGIRSIRTISQQPVIDRIPMWPCTRTYRQFNVRFFKLIASKSTYQSYTLFIHGIRCTD